MDEFLPQVLFDALQSSFAVFGACPPRMLCMLLSKSVT